MCWNETYRSVKKVQDYAGVLRMWEELQGKISPVLSLFDPSVYCFNGFGSENSIGEEWSHLTGVKVNSPLHTTQTNWSSVCLHQHLVGLGVFDQQHPSDKEISHGMPSIAKRHNITFSDCGYCVKEGMLDGLLFCKAK